MKTSSLFVSGLALGALAVFAVRAVSLGRAEPEAPHASPSATAPSPDAHAPESHVAETPSPASDRPPENRICPVMGNPVDPEVYVDHEGRRIGFCCPGCDTLFLEDPAKYLKKVDAELASRTPAPAAEDRPPENKICPVMGNPVDPEVYMDHEGRRIGFCCPGCDTLFLEDPAKYLKKVDVELAGKGEK